jgi:hypothetical protein
MPAGASRRSLCLAVLVCALVALAVTLLDGGGTRGSSALAAGGQPEDTYQTDDAVPAIDMMLIGSSPKEAPDETWGIARGIDGSQSFLIMRYVQHEGWTRGPAMLDSAEKPLEGFEPSSDSLAGEVTPDGSGVLAGFLTNSAEKPEVVLVRDPGKPFTETLPVSVAKEEGEEAILAKGEELFAHREPLVAAIEEGSSAGALVVPDTGTAATARPAVLHWEGGAGKWTREPVKLPEGAKPEEFQPIALAAQNPENAWLLAHVSGGEAVSLFRRTPGSEGHPASWMPVSPGSGKEPGAPFEVAGEPLSDPDRAGAQRLTVTGKGLWIDGERGTASVTLFFKPAPAPAAAGNVEASWCNVEKACTGSLPEELPTGEYRSFAWEEPEPYGARVITGFREGAIVRLEGEQFARHYTVGGPQEPEEVGVAKGAAFSGPYEGWLGQNELPVHATQEPEADELEYWPAPFQRPLLAIASAPAQLAGEKGSEALAVGEGGEVARYIPGEGWHAEGLRELSGKFAHPQLRGVAWPVPAGPTGKGGRAYAVGDRVESDGTSIAEMWLWRSETELWEPDPAAPVNLRANLLGIAFEPGGSRGYVIGQEGTLLRYGKTWTQESVCQAGATPQPCIPQEAAGANFTSIAFAGTEALVAYRVPHLSGGVLTYTGGVLANSGSGWRVDSEIPLPAGYAPWAVAGLPDGGAALSASDLNGDQEPAVLERQRAGSPWEATPPLGSRHVPAWLALFREGGALRAVASGTVPTTRTLEEQTPPPAGFPPLQTPAYPTGLSSTAAILRQTANGWSDVEHERHVLDPPPGGYLHWDIPYAPDPTAAILLNETGTSGWAVGGIHAENVNDETADIARFPAEHPGQHAETPGSGRYAIRVERPPEKGGQTQPAAPEKAEYTTLAVGGNAECAASCAALVNSRVGPDVWLEHALDRAQEIDGLGAFLYLGPHVTAGKAEHSVVVPYADEFLGYRELLEGAERFGAAASGNPVRTYAVPSSTDREPDGSECAFDAALFPAEREPGLALAKRGECGSAQSSYYSFLVPPRQAGTPEVQVIVLDDGEVGSEPTVQVSETQLQWLRTELENAEKAKRPAIVAGNADLAAAEQSSNGDAGAVVEALVKGHASAYLFDAPEQNIETARLGGSVPSFGSGTLGYIDGNVNQEEMFTRASGFLLVEVGQLGTAGVRVRLIPDIEELSLDAHKGIRLRRSEAALFSAIARRPRAGGRGSGLSSENENTNFIPLSPCVGGECAQAILPEYRFASKNPEIGEFVTPNLRAEPNGEEPELGSNEKPIDDPTSGLFCAYNPGQTEVSVEAGGLTASLPVTVEAGSPRRPCGTVPAKPQAKTKERGVPAPASPPGPAPTSSPAGAAPLVPVPPLPPVPTVPLPTPRPLVALPPPFLVPPALVVPSAAIVPPPLPPVAEPTPPSGTSAVTSPVEAAQREEEQEEATESVSAQASAYHQNEHEPIPEYLLGLIVIAAFAGATTARRRPRRGAREVRIAPATLSAARSQRQMSRPRRPPQ